MVDVVHRTAEQVFIPFTVGGGIRTRRGRPADAARRRRQGQRQHGGRRAARADRRDRRPSSARSASCARSTPSAAPTVGFEVYLHGGRTPTGIDAVAWAAERRQRGRRRDPAHVDGPRRHPRRLRPRADPGRRRRRRRAGDRQRRRRARSSTSSRASSRAAPTPCWRRRSSTSASTRSPRPRR